MTLAALVERWAGGEDTATEVARAVRALSVPATIALAAQLRAGRGLDHRFQGLRRTTTVPNLELGALLSMHRNGYLRATGLAALLQTGDPFALRFLVLRLDDIVEATRERAREALWDRLDRNAVDELIQLLPLLRATASRQRGGASGILRDAQRYLSRNAFGRVAEAALVGARPVRREAVALLFADPVRALPILQEALGDRDPAVARQVAIFATIAPAPVRDVLLPLLEVSRDPAIRRRAVLTRAHERHPYVERALTDPRASVRFTARAKLPGRARAACLAALADPARLVGALGGLAELGDRADAAHALPFATHPDARIRAEAIRCLARLAPEEHADVLRAAAGDLSARVRREAQ